MVMMTHQRIENRGVELKEDLDSDSTTDNDDKEDNKDEDKDKNNEDEDDEDDVDNEDNEDKEEEDDENEESGASNGESGASINNVGTPNDRARGSANNVVPVFAKEGSSVDRTFIGAGTVAANFGIYLCNN